MGATSAWGGLRVRPRPVEALIAGSLWLLALSLEGQLGGWIRFPAWVGAGAVAGMALGLLPGVRRGASLRRDGSPRSPVVGVRTRFNRRMRQVGDFHGRVLLIQFYFVLVAPFGLFARFAVRDRLRRARPEGQSYWIDPAPETADLERARKQY